MSAGFYKRRRGIVEHLESGEIDILDLGIHDFLNLKANLVIGSLSSIPPGICITSAAAIYAVCGGGQISYKTIQRRLSRLEKIGWIKRFNQRGKRGNYPVLICRASVHDLSGNEYRINGADTTDWRFPKWKPVRESSADCQIAVPLLSTLREGRTEKREGREKNPAAKPAPPADPRHSEFAKFAHAGFEAKYGQKPSWLGKDWKALQNLLARAPSLGLPELQTRWQNYLASTDLFTVKQGGSLAYFCAHADSFITGPIFEKGGSNGKTEVDPNQRTRDNLRAAGLNPN